MHLSPIYITFTFYLHFSQKPRKYAIFRLSKFYITFTFTLHFRNEKKRHLHSPQQNTKNFQHTFFGVYCRNILHLQETIHHAQNIAHNIVKYDVYKPIDILHIVLYTDNGGFSSHPPCNLLRGGFSKFYFIGI